MIKRRSKVLLLFSLVLLVSTLVFLLAKGTKTTSYKCIMPGSFQLPLKESNDYWVWIFPKWVSLGLSESSDNKRSIEITRKDGAPLRINYFKNEINYSDNFRSGFVLGSISVLVSGDYVFTGDGRSPFLMIVVPQTANYYGLGSSIEFTDLQSDRIEIPLKNHLDGSPPKS